jgi:hypothetical protein
MSTLIGQRCSAVVFLGSKDGALGRAIGVPQITATPVTTSEGFASCPQG